MSVTRRTSLIVCLSAIAILAGCSSGSSSSSNNNTKRVVSITFGSAPPSTLTINETLDLSATVDNDPYNSGVDWSVSCGDATSCGSLSELHSDSGATVTFYPPTSFTGNSEDVKIVAFATSDHTKNALASIAVKGFADQLTGTYVFHVAGTNFDPFTGVQGQYHLAGVVNLDGNGGVALVDVNGQTIGGEQISNDSSNVFVRTITGGTYSIGPDGRGTLALSTVDSKGATSGDKFALTILSPSEVLLVQTDSASPAQGSMELQTSTALPSAGYAFTAKGTDGHGAFVAIGGVLNVDDASGGISGNGSVADRFYRGALLSCPPPATASDPKGISGSISAPDVLGAVTLTLSPCFATHPLTFTGYIVDAAHIALIETDVNANGTATGYSTGGIAVGQGSATGTYSSFSGQFVFGISGTDASGFNASLTTAAMLNVDSTGGASGTLDQFTIRGVSFSDDYTGTATVDPAHTGRVDIPVTFKNHASSPSPEYIVYQTATGASPLVLEIDSKISAAGVGTAYPQTMKATFTGSYGMVAPQMRSFGLETDFVGEFTPDSAGLTVAGTIDGLGYIAAELSGTYVAPPDNGRFSGTLAAPAASGSSLQGTAAVQYYLADSDQGFFVETDLKQTTLGYFARRTPVCPSCP